MNNQVNLSCFSAVSAELLLIEIWIII